MINHIELVTVTPPAAPAVPVADALEHLRIDNTAADTALVTAQLVAAQAYIEDALTWRALTPRSLQATFDCWPESGPLWLPYPPLTAVTELAVIDDLNGGAITVVAPAAYRVDLGLGRIVYLQAVPPSGRIRVKYACGYATAPPFALRAAILLFLGHLYENRETVTVGAGLTAIDVPRGVSDLCAPYRAWRPGGAA